MSGKKAAAHQQAVIGQKRHQASRPARRWHRQHLQLAAIGQRQVGVLFDHRPRRLGRRRRSITAGLLPAPELIEQLGAGIGDHQLHLWVLAHQGMQQRHPIGVDVALHHLQRLLRLQQFVEAGEEGLSEGGPRGVHQYCRFGRIVAVEQEAVVAATPLEGVLHFKAGALWAEAAQAGQPPIDRQLQDRALIAHQ